MSNPHHHALVRELIERMVEHMLDGLDADTALVAAGEEMKRDIRLHLARAPSRSRRFRWTAQTPAPNFTR